MDGSSNSTLERRTPHHLPWLMTESGMLSCMIVAKEGCDVAAAAISGTFMQTDVDKKIHMGLEGPMAELLVKIDPKLYRKYLVHEGKKMAMDVELQMALCRGHKRERANHAN